jgi:hypothetical protein
VNSHFRVVFFLVSPKGRNGQDDLFIGQFFICKSIRGKQLLPIKYPASLKWYRAIPFEIPARKIYGTVMNYRFFIFEVPATGKKNDDTDREKNNISDPLLDSSIKIKRTSAHCVSHNNFRGSESVISDSYFTKAPINKNLKSKALKSDWPGLRHVVNSNK